jgi:pyruvate-ferredoxin/flavodoxin oxidoreductase
MADRPTMTLDGNEASSRVAYLTNEVISIYPITPASPMGENSDAWAAQGKPNIWGSVPDVIEMQSEAGAAGACHGSLQAGALTTTFTASQGLLLMIPNMFKVAGELSPTVFHISARCVATHALSIFAEHSDVMACRGTGWAMLASGSVQESQDMAMISQMATLESRIPFLHFFDGFRTSHEVNKIEALSEEEIRDLTDENLVQACRDRAMNPDRPIIRGTAQNPDVFFQARESCNPFYLAAASITQKCMDRFAERTGRQYHNFDYVGAPDAERVVVIMASGFGAGDEAIERLVKDGEKVGMLKVRLYRPFDTVGFVNAIPESVKTLVVLDRTKEPGSIGEPLFTDTVAALFEEWSGAKGGKALPRVIGGRYGISSKEFTPAMFKACLDEAGKDEPKRHFTVGIHDDITQTSLEWDASWSTEPDEVTRGVFWGLGSDGTVGASKNSVKIIAENTPMYSQGYFVYDSKKAGSVTVSHLRFGPKPINSTYLIDRANFVSCSQFNFLERFDVLGTAEPGATFLLNSPYGVDEVWDKIPKDTQQQIIDKKLKFYVIDAAQVAIDAGLGGRMNTVMQTAFFKLSGILPEAEAIQQIKDAIEKSYSKRGRTVVERNFAAVDGTVSGVKEVKIPGSADGTIERVSFAVEDAPEYVRDVTSKMIAGLGEELPVSAFAPDGTFPTGTTKYEKRSVARDIPIWDAEVCIDCAVCSLVCPHAAIRMKVFEEKDLEGAPAEFQHKKWRGKDLPEGTLLTIQVAPDDCTGCGVCVDVCPAKDKTGQAQGDQHAYSSSTSSASEELGLLPDPRARPDQGGDGRDEELNQLLEPLFEFSGACSGCGETPYVKLLSQLFGDRMLVANATGCSSIYGGNLPTTPVGDHADGRGPGLEQLAVRGQRRVRPGHAPRLDAPPATPDLLVDKSSRDDIGDELALRCSRPAEPTEAEYRRAARRVALASAKRTRAHGDPAGRGAQPARSPTSSCARSTWIVGGDGWAYDIGFGGLDHVLASAATSTCWCSTPRSTPTPAARPRRPRRVARSPSSRWRQAHRQEGPRRHRPSLRQRLRRPDRDRRQRHRRPSRRSSRPRPGTGPSLIIAYSTCIAHGIDMTYVDVAQKDAVKSGYWPLYRYGRGQTAGHGRRLRRGHGLLPADGDLQHRTAGLSRQPDRDQKGCAHPGLRQPQRPHQGWLGALREADAGRRGRRPRAEHLRRADRRRDEPGRRRDALPRADHGGQRGADDPPRGQDRPLLQLAGERRRSDERGRR